MNATSCKFADKTDLPDDKYLIIGGDLTEAIWTSDGQPILLEDLPITDQLRTKLDEWIRLTDDFEYYLPKKDRAPFDLKGFTATGLTLAKELKAELPDWTILYCDEWLWQNRDDLFLSNDDCRYEVTENEPATPPYQGSSWCGSNTHFINSPVRRAEPSPTDKLRLDYQNQRDTLPSTLALRTYRAISWIGRADSIQNDTDEKVISLLIAMSALYTDDREGSASHEEQKTVRDTFLQKLLEHDTDNALQKLLWDKLHPAIYTLSNDHYLFAPYWHHKHGHDSHGDWEKHFHLSVSHYEAAIKAENATGLLSILFDRLHVLRSQLLYGGATWQSSLNRQPIEQAAIVLGTLLPTFITIMIHTPHENWHRPFYPVFS